MKNILIAGGVVIFFVASIALSNILQSSDPTLISTRGIHYHPQLEIYIQGEKQEIPAGIGLVGGHSPLHTHDPDGVIHLEYGGTVHAEDTTLGRFFEIWGKKFSKDQIFDFVNGPEGVVSMTVNGVPNTEFENYHMKDGDKIVIRYEKK